MNFWKTSGTEFNGSAVVTPQPLYVLTVVSFRYIQERSLKFCTISVRYADGRLFRSEIVVSNSFQYKIDVNEIKTL